jgi:hypothetical protein
MNGFNAHLLQYASQLIPVTVNAKAILGTTLPIESLDGPPQLLLVSPKQRDGAAQAGQDGADAGPEEAGPVDDDMFSWKRDGGICCSAGGVGDGPGMEVETRSDEMAGGRGSYYWRNGVREAWSYCGRHFDLPGRNCERSPMRLFCGV